MNKTSHALKEKNNQHQDGLNAEWLGVLRRETFWTLGQNRAHSFFVRIGMAQGRLDFVQKRSHPLTQQIRTQLEAQLKEPHEGSFRFKFDHSLEAEEHRRFFDSPSKETQCWFLSGYCTGWVSQFLEQPVYFLEDACQAQGRPVCQFVGKSRDSWEMDDALKLNLYDEDNVVLELAETRQQLKLTKDRYQNLFEQSSVPIVIVNPDTGHYLDANLAAEELTGYPREELLTLNVFDLRPADEHHEAVHYLRSILTNERINSPEMVLVRKDENRRIILQTSKVLSYGGERVIQTVMRDITDLKESETKEKVLQKQLIRSERLSSIGRLAAGVAHELKNPLGSIRNAIYYIRGALTNSELIQSDPHLKNIMELAESEVDSSVRIIEELLDFSRVIELVPRQTQINSLLEKLPQTIPVPKGIDIIMDLDQTLPMAQVDPDRLKQVFSNIFSNGVQAMSKGGRLTVKSRLEVGITSDEEKKLERVMIAFEDTGQGIQPVHLKKIFEPLFTTKARGTGLGLSISSNIIEKHGGVIQVTSQPGRGTCFTVKVPLQSPERKEEGTP